MVRRIEAGVITWLAPMRSTPTASRRRRASTSRRDGGEAKIAALGLRVRNGCTYHGVAVNIDMDLSPFADIDPCGYPGLAGDAARAISACVASVGRRWRRAGADPGAAARGTRRAMSAVPGSGSDAARRADRHGAAGQRRRRQAQGRIQDRADPDQGRRPPRSLRKPEWIRVRAPSSPRFHEIKQILREHRLHTVCEEASCPNIGECFGKGTATFMIMGDICTRRCPFCDVGHGRPLPLDADEPVNLARDDRGAAAALRRRSPASIATTCATAARSTSSTAYARCASIRRRRRSRCWCPISAAGSTARSTSSARRRPT